jgi:hypothetical protein
MKFVEVSPVRSFRVGLTNVVLHHVADIRLEADELITLLNSRSNELDVVAKSWGYYVTPSLTGRLRTNGMRAALMRNVETRHLFVVVVDTDHLSDWHQYMADENQEIMMWLDEAES